MGLRATSIKTYKIEYGDHSGFNYGADTLSNIISDFCEDFYNGDDGYGGLSTDAIWEVDKDEFSAMIGDIENMSEEEFNERMEEDWHGTEDEGYTKAYVLNLFKNFLNDTAEDSIYVRIAWL